MMPTPLRIFIGYDARESIAFHVLSDSILRHATVPVAITPLKREHLKPLYSRTRGPLESTDFSMTRFLVPALCQFAGYAVFMDCDMLMRADVAELWGHIVLHFTGRVPRALAVCQHDYTPSASVKFLGQPQTAYPRKNWSSFMLFNNARCRALTPDYVNQASGLDLHRLTWLRDDEIGALPIEWNWLVGEYADGAPDIKNLHWTLGGPWFAATRQVSYADQWHEAHARLFSTG